MTFSRSMIKFGKLYIVNKKTFCLEADPKVIGYDYDKKKYYCDDNNVKEFDLAKGDMLIPVAEDGPLRAKILVGDKFYLTHIDDFSLYFKCMEM